MAIACASMGPIQIGNILEPSLSSKKIIDSVMLVAIEYIFNSISLPVSFFLLS